MHYLNEELRHELPSLWQAEVEQLALTLQKKDPVYLKLLRFEPYAEGQAAQIMHIGPFSEEGPTVEKVHKFIKGKGAKPAGLHHEIYLSDIRKGNPANWKTVIRQPFK